MIYLAQPYSHPDPAIRELRWWHAKQATEYLMKEGKNVYSPVLHSHALYDCLPRGWEFWKRPSLAMVELCSDFYILQIHGWDESVGVMDEWRRAVDLKKTVKYLRQIGDGYEEFDRP